MTTLPRDILLDPITHDLAFDSEGRLSWATGDALIKQRIEIRLRTETGEWTYDTGLGLPYRRSILVKNPDMVLIRGLIVAQVKKVPGVRKVLRLDPVFDKAARRLTISFRVQTENSTTVEGTI